MVCTVRAVPKAASWDNGTREMQGISVQQGCSKVNTNDNKNKLILIFIQKHKTLRAQTG